MKIWQLQIRGPRGPGLLEEDGCGVDSFFDLKMKSLAARRCARNTYLRMHGQRMSGAAGGHEHNPHGWLDGLGPFPRGTTVRYQGGSYTVQRVGLGHDVVISDGIQEITVACSELMPVAVAVDMEAHMRSLYPPDQTVQVMVDGAEGQEAKAAFVRDVFWELETHLNISNARKRWFAKVEYVMLAETTHLSRIVPLEDVWQSPYCSGMQVTLKDGTGLVGTITRVYKEEYTVHWADGSITKERFSKVSALPVPG